METIKIIKIEETKRPKNGFKINDKYLVRIGYFNEYVECFNNEDIQLGKEITFRIMVKGNQKWIFKKFKKFNEY